MTSAMLSAIEGSSPQEQIRVLIVDDEDPICRTLSRDLRLNGYAPTTVNGGADAIDLINSEPFDVIVCDLLMPEVDGLDVLRYARSRPTPIPVVMITAYGNIGSAVKAMKEGASDFITKPLDNIEVRAAVQVAFNQNTNKRRPQAVAESRLVGSKRWLEPFNELLQKVANSNSTVLLTGETGTGKTEVAKEIARLSSRPGKFHALNCAAIPETLLEARLFGTVKGAYTGAEDKAGVLEDTAGGTLFLDEIGELKPELQAKLLHVLQEKTFTRLGTTTEQRADVRFITATNRDLEAEVASGNFRKDLYFRLQVTLEIPPLKNRPEDVPLLLEHFRNLCEDHVPEFTPEAITMLQRYEWPGNIRELRNLIERFAVFAEKDRPITPEDLEVHVSRSTCDVPAMGAVPLVRSGHEADGDGPEPTPSGPAFALDLDGQSLEDAVNGYMRGVIVRALRRNKGNKSKTARELQMKRTTLIERCHKLDITDDDIDGDDDD